MPEDRLKSPFPLTEATGKGSSGRNHTEMDQFFSSNIMSFKSILQKVRINFYRVFRQNEKVLGKFIESADP